MIDVTVILRAVVAVTVPSRVVPPSAPVKISLPGVKVRSKFPSTVVTVISPADVPALRTTLASRVIGLAKEILLLLAETLLAKFTAPAPVCENPPSPNNVFPTVVVNIPELAMVIGPLLLVVALPRNVKTDPVRLMPPTPVVVRSLLKRVVPVPADWVIVAALMACVVTLRAVEIIKFTKGCDDPAFPETVKSPVPEDTVRLPGVLIELSSVLKRVIG